MNARAGYSRTGTLKKKIVADRKALQDSHDDSANGDQQANGLQSDLLAGNYANQRIDLHGELPSSRPADDQPSTKRKGPRGLAAESLAGADENELPGDLNGQFNEFNDLGGHLESYSVAGEIKKIDMKVIEPYTRVLSHAGYYTNRSDANIGGRNSMTLFLFLLLLFFLLYKTLN